MELSGLYNYEHQVYSLLTRQQVWKFGVIWNFFKNVHRLHVDIMYTRSQNFRGFTLNYSLIKVIILRLVYLTVDSISSVSLTEVLFIYFSSKYSSRKKIHLKKMKPKITYCRFMKSLTFLRHLNFWLMVL